MARPKTDKYNITDMVKKIEKYANDTELPILKEICYLNKWNYDYIMQLQRDHDELYQSIKTLINKKEVELERGGLLGKYNNTMAIFSLKQLGWKDRQEVETTTTSRIVIVDDLNEPRD